MAYTIPDYAAFIARFPIFSDTTQYPQPQVETLLVEASGQVDTDWLERDYAPAIMYLTAHMLALDNSGADDAIDIGVRARSPRSLSPGCRSRTRH
jgi:hypothetical protein